MTLRTSWPIGDTPNTRPVIPKRQSGSLAGISVSPGEAKRTPAPASDNSILKSISRFFSGLPEKFASLKASVIRLLFRDNEVPIPPHAEQQPSNAAIDETDHVTGPDSTGKTSCLAEKGPDDLFIPPEMKFDFDEKAKESRIEILTDDPRMQEHAFEVLKWALSNHPRHRNKDGTPNFTIKSVAIENGIQIRIKEPKNTKRDGHFGEIGGGQNPLEKYFKLVAALDFKNSEIGEYLDNEYLIKVLTSGNLGIHKEDLGNVLIYPSNSKLETFNQAALFCHYLAKIGKHSLASKLFVDLKYNTDWQKASDYDEKIKVVKVLEADLSRLEVKIPEVAGDWLPVPLRPQ
jgi:hypothetical protein